ncbi:MAG: flagellar biosynthesis protein FlgB [Bryobacteraceae bacterium]|nr:flagellar biosynthesis protein FlgB [Bryobacteraceae bacterium]
MLNSIAGRVEQYLDVLAARQKLTASNIANADTPGYKTKDVDFAAAFAQAEGTGDIPAVEVSGLSLKPDGNNVSLDRESRNLAESALRFNIATQFLQNQSRMAKVALQEIR